VKRPDGLGTSGTIPRSLCASENGKLTRPRMCWTVKPIANCGTGWLQSRTANMDGAADCRWKSHLFPHAALNNLSSASP
jgi:hypothetical protein